MQGVVFKQRYKAVSVKNVAVLNQKHLEYMATRKGTIKNPGCGFGLWGKFPGQYQARNIENLQMAKKLIGQVSKNKTIYRVILSVDDETAKTKELYERSSWEKLLNERISCIPKEMAIQPGNFNWCASMHYKKGHPHVHILYWDNGNDPRMEYMPPNRFEEASEKIRAAFNRGIFENELKAIQAEKQTVESDFRFDVKQWLLEANPYKVLNLDLISQKRLDESTAQLLDLIRFAPSSGSLKYQYLKEDYKAKIDDFVNSILKLPGFEAEEVRFLELTDEVSSLYGNGPETTAKNRENQRNRLHKNLANEVLKAVADCLKEIRQEIENQMEGLEFPQLEKNLLNTANKILQTDTKFEHLLQQMPSLKTPLQTLDEEQKKQFEDLVHRVWQDVRLKSQINMFLKNGDFDDETKKEVFRKLGGILRREVWAQLTEKKGYNEQLVANRMMTLLIQCFRLTSQHTSQVKSQSAGLKKRSKNLSREQKKEQAARFNQAGDWEMEL